MSRKVRLGLWLLAWVLILCSDFTWCEFRKSIPTETGDSICSLSRKLKDVAPWTRDKIETLRKTRNDYGSKFIDWQLHFYRNSACEENESILEEIRIALGAVNEELETLSRKAIRAGALAAKSAGRLDEFITVFANAKGGKFVENTNYCLGGGSVPAKRRNLFECFPTGNNSEMGESNLAKIHSVTTNGSETNLTAVVERIAHSSLVTYLSRKYESAAGCNLIKGASGGVLEGANLSTPLLWGGGILTIGKDFCGTGNFGPGGIANASSGSKAFWTAYPHTIQHLKKTLAAFQSFKDATEIITQKFAEIEKIEKKIELCLSNETMEEGHTQSCFKSSVKLNAELQAANALLARYHKEKGPLPSEGALILHQSVAKVLYLIAALI